MKINLDIFHAYDIRGIYPDQINEELGYKTAQAYAKFINPKNVVLGRDVRESGPVIFEAVKKGLLDHGVDVIDIGVVTTDMLYFTVANYGYDGGIIISASHNPREFNGLKLVKKSAVPISGDSGVYDIRDLVLNDYQYQAKNKGEIIRKDVLEDYLARCLSLINISKIKPFKVVVNGMFGPAVQNLLKANLPIQLSLLNENPDGSFPKGAPDPLLEENRIETVEFIKKEKADLGAAWDADADRFFLFDETGRWIPGYYLTAFLGEYYSKAYPGAKIIHDPRLTWAIIDKVKSNGGVPFINKAGHSFIKERMRKEDATFGGEMSGHYYFKNYFYCDNGLIPFLVLLQIISESGKKVSELFDEYFEKYPISGEMNFDLASMDLAEPIFKRIQEKYAEAKIYLIDGLSVEFPDWRANIRSSNTQPLIRLNVEAKSSELVGQKVRELSELIRQ
ncbi:phosphomannomutase/phosphoglucomutase [Candidatus Nomurabacteria bacterium]|nr:phosphomannomutase/phosphoglucomutase [Candidatus Nomurabacteria bacterium]